MMRPTEPGRHASRGRLAIAAAAAVAACSCGPQAGCSPGADPAKAPPPPTVTVAEARRMSVPLRANPNGTTRALQEVAIRARVRGFLREQKFEEGSDVKTGQLLFVIEEEPYQAKLAMAKAKLAEAEANLEKAKQSKAPEVATAQLALDQALLALARIDEGRQRALVQRNATSPESFDQAQANRKKNEAQVDADKANLDQARADYDVNIQAAQANVEGARADVTNAEIELGYCRLSSPIDGRIGEAKVKVGNLVGSSSTSDATVLATIQQLDPIGVDVEASSRYLARATALIREGLTVRLTRPGFEGEQEHPHPGKAFFIDNAIDPSTSTFLIKAEVPNPEKGLLPGEYVKVAITIGEVPAAVVVPERAVMETQGGQALYLVDAAGKVAIARVKAGETYEGLRVIESGLEPGQSVIVDGLQLVRPGMPVRTETIEAKAAPTGGATDIE